MKIRLFTLLSLLTLLIAGCGTQPTPQDIESLKGTVISTFLRGSPSYPFTTGKAKYSVNGNEREFQVEMETVCYYNYCGPVNVIGKAVRVYVNGSLVGSMRVSALGLARLNRNTERGQIVPNIAVGSLVEVKTTTGLLIVSGKF